MPHSAVTSGIAASTLYDPKVGSFVMGAALSGFASSLNHRHHHRSQLDTAAGLGDIPESCAALVLLHLPPPEICRLARLNRAFAGAAGADLVWEPKLPENYSYLFDRLVGSRVPAGLTKKEVFARLSRPTPLDGGLKEAWLDKNSGGVCLALSSQTLAITGIDDRRYWTYIPTEESRFHSVAYLQQIWWFEVDGEVEFQFPAGRYSLFVRLLLGRPSKKLGRRNCNTEHTHGWDVKPVRFQLTTADGQHCQNQFYLDQPGNWICYHAGDFLVESSEVVTHLKFSVTQINCTHTKGGLCVDHAFICPIAIGDKLKRRS